MSAFRKAEKKRAKLRLALTGVSGAGKTFSALVMAKALGGRVALVDSERSSALLYADRFEFDHLDLSDHSIDRYRAAIKDAAAAGYDVLVVDSLSHEWAGRGGALEEVDRKKASGNGFAAWNGTSQKHQSLVDDLLQYPGHVIVTMRSKTEYVLEDVDRGGRKVQVPRKVGMAPVQRDGIEYEFTVLLSLDKSGSVLVEKSRCSAVEERAATLRREDLDDVAGTLRAWLADGGEPTPLPSPIGTTSGNLTPGLSAGVASRVNGSATSPTPPSSPPSNVTPMGPTLEVQVAEWAAKFAQCATVSELEAAGRELAAKPNGQLRDAVRPAYGMRHAALMKAVRT